MFHMIPKNLILEKLRSVSGLVSAERTPSGPYGQREKFSPLSPCTLLLPESPMQARTVCLDQGVVGSYQARLGTELRIRHLCDTYWAAVGDGQIGFWPRSVGPGITLFRILSRLSVFKLRGLECG